MFLFGLMWQWVQFSLSDYRTEVLTPKCTLKDSGNGGSKMLVCRSLRCPKEAVTMTCVAKQESPFWVTNRTLSSPSSHRIRHTGLFSLILLAGMLACGRGRTLTDGTQNCKGRREQAYQPSLAFPYLIVLEQGIVPTLPLEVVAEVRVLVRLSGRDVQPTIRAFLAIHDLARNHYITTNALYIGTCFPWSRQKGKGGTSSVFYPSEKQIAARTVKRTKIRQTWLYGALAS